MNTAVDSSIASHSNEIRAEPFAKYIVSEDVIERNFGYKIIRQQVSSGKHSLIYKCEHNKHPEVYCLIKPYKLGKDQIKKSLKEETCQIMQYVSGKCPQLISTMDIFYTSEKIYLMCDWASKGEVLANLKAHTVRLNEKMLRDWTMDMLSAVDFMHKNAICHRNISPGSLLLTSENRVKIGNLGDAVVYCKPDGTIIRQKWPRFSRTANWNQGPEVAKGRLYDARKADIWCVGATVYWFITRSHPIDYNSNTKMPKQLEQRLSYMRKVSDKCMAFVKKMLQYQPSSRPFVPQALQLEWISGGGPSTPAAGKEVEITMAEKDPGETAGQEEVVTEPEGSIAKATQAEQGNGQE